MLATRHVRPDPWTPPASSAVAMLRDGDALIATMTGTDGPIGIRELTCTHRDEAAHVWFLHKVVELIGQRDRLLIIGPYPIGQECERAYVLEYGRAGRLIDVEPLADMDREDLEARVRELAG